MCFLSAIVILGADWCQCVDTNKEAHPTTSCLKMPLSMLRSVNIDHTHPNIKICCMCVGGGVTSSRFGALALIRKHTSVSTDGSNT